MIVILNSYSTKLQSGHQLVLFICISFFVYWVKGSLCQSFVHVWADAGHKWPDIQTFWGRISGLFHLELLKIKCVTYQASIWSTLLNYLIPAGHHWRDYQAVWEDSDVNEDTSGRPWVWLTDRSWKVSGKSNLHLNLTALNRISLLFFMLMFVFRYITCTLVICCEIHG